MSNEPVFRLMAEWTATPTAKEVETLRSLFYRIKDLTPAVMMRAAREKKKIDLGRYTESELLPIMEILETMNIRFSRNPIITS